MASATSRNNLQFSQPDRRRRALGTSWLRFGSPDNVGSTTTLGYYIDTSPHADLALRGPVTFHGSRKVPQ